jgi:hypothetical protein
LFLGGWELKIEIRVRTRWEQPVTFEDACDWNKSTAPLAAQAPAHHWPAPG